VLVADDGSTDATVMVAGAVAAVDRRVRVLSYHPNRGKGFAVRTGMLAAEGELIVFTDADGSYGPSQLARIVEALGEAPVAIGTAPAPAGQLPGGPPAGPSTWRSAARLGCRLAIPRAD
jgi:dolichyl-phosphate beta-glucosyltransferase